MRSQTDSETVQGMRVGQKRAIVVVAERRCIEHAIRYGRDIPGFLRFRFRFRRCESVNIVFLREED